MNFLKKKNIIIASATVVLCSGLAFITQVNEGAAQENPTSYRDIQDREFEDLGNNVLKDPKTGAMYSHENSETTPKHTQSN